MDYSSIDNKQIKSNVKHSLKINLRTKIVPKILYHMFFLTFLSPRHFILIKLDRNQLSQRRTQRYRRNVPISHTTFLLQQNRLVGKRIDLLVRARVFSQHMFRRCGQSNHLLHSTRLVFLRVEDYISLLCFVSPLLTLFCLIKVTLFSKTIVLKPLPRIRMLFCWCPLFRLHYQLLRRPRTIVV